MDNHGFRTGSPSSSVLECTSMRMSSSWPVIRTFPCSKLVVVIVRGNEGVDLRYGQLDAHAAQRTCAAVTATLQEQLLQ